MQSLDSAIFSPKCMWEFLMFLVLAKQVWKKCNIRKLEEITQKYIPLLVHLNALALAVQMIFGLFPILKFPIIGAFIHFSSSLCIMLNGRVGKHAKDKPRCIVAVIAVFITQQYLLFCFASVECSLHLLHYLFLLRFYN